MFETKFLKATAERAVKTFVQTLLAIIGTDAAGVLTVDFTAALQVAGASALLSVLTSFASSGVGKAGPSLAGESTEPLVKIETVEKIVEKLVEVSTTKPAAPAKKAAPKKSASTASPKRTQK
jgi:hypothetical protein